MSYRYLGLKTALSICLAFGVAACSDNNDPSTGDGNTLTQSQAQDVGQDAAEDVEEMIEASSFDGSTGLTLTTDAGTAFSAPPSCVDVSPNPPINSDNDIVPDSLRLDFSNCQFIRGNGQIVDSLGGTIDFIDPLPLQASFGVRHILTDLSHKRVNLAFPARSFSVVHNGQREWGGSADTLGHTVTNLVSVWTNAAGRSATHTKNWYGKFVADEAGSIALGSPLPAGNWTVNGSSTWSTANRSWSIVVSTPEALHFDPSCEVSPRLTDGTLDLVVTRNGAVTNVEVTFINCGVYQVTRSVGG